MSLLKRLLFPEPQESAEVLRERRLMAKDRAEHELAKKRIEAELEAKKEKTNRPITFLGIFLFIIIFILISTGVI